MKRVVLQITLWMVLLESNLLLAKAASFKNKQQSGNGRSLEYPPVPQVQYDDYPMVVPKRAAMLLDRLMVALHHALEKGEGEDGGGRPINKVYRDTKYGGRPVTNGMVKQQQPPQQQQQPSKTEQLMKSYYAEAEGEDSEEANVIPDGLDELEGRRELLDEMMDIQTRGTEDKTKKGRYWKCYFNAVSCF
ncbi:uncharacterized protein LOC129776451 [Toxorhynchites rutilus septentrionalis]|uniref:uncharacterized protein LOC129776451 n=1 Tax=Toxorhynchites rutilus septentrionalis TaxID=329112 RepID=UPI0024788DF3|nr:uncharacterized protein LOC129776451 [Toxorhynchites rutilus septentrionalis]